MSTSVPSRPDVQDTGCGFTISKQFSLDAFRSALTYNPRPDDLFIVTYPKSGTTWMQIIVACICRRGRPFESALEFFSESPFLEMTGSEGPLAMKRPGAIKTHLPFHLAPWSDEAKYIYVARNPKDVCVSFFNHVKNMNGYNFTDGQFDDYFEIFMEGKVNFGDYFGHLRSWYDHKDDPNVLFVTYEELKTDVKSGILRIAEFMGQEYKVMLESDPQILNDVIEHSSFRYMKENFDRQVAELSATAHETVKRKPELIAGLKVLFSAENKLFGTASDSVSFVRKGVVGDWKNYFSQEQIKRMDEKFREKMKGTDIPNLWKGII
ncbi:hypothetical protein JTE90_028305 [Oedothorax gibbosus]|uniref:Sulfotransferase domain-containing protein n=1 Tax=Oedothorax gibbosus TaxID=931172 RepID=A0AAV6U0M4_9ARAC|nr:hypothetical protein JTE90_028305 [Oedothorax gibbosus]